MPRGLPGTENQIRFLRWSSQLNPGGNPTMKRLLLPLIAAAALAVRASGLAWDGHHGGDGDRHGTYAARSGTGTAFSGGTATATGSVVAGNDHPNGHFSASISTNWSAAQTHTFTDN